MVNARFLGMLIFWAAPVLALAIAVDRSALEGATSVKMSFKHQRGAWP